MGRKCLDLTGKRFGMLVAIEKTEKKSKYGYPIWKCKCDCGNVAYVIASNLNNGITKSCGCLKLSNPSCSDNAEERILKYKISCNNTSGYKGISYAKSRHKWEAYISFNKKHIYLLRSYDINDCIAIRKKAEEAVANGTFEQWIEEYKGGKCFQ